MININGINERLKELRKTLNLTQQKMGENMGIKTSTYSDIENGRRELTDRNKKILCQAINVNPEWLDTGNGEMFVETQDDIINQLIEEYSLDIEDKSLITGYLELSENDRIAVKRFIRNIKLNGANAADERAGANVANPALSDCELSSDGRPLSALTLEELQEERRKAEEEYIKSMSENVKRKTFTALNSTDENEENKQA